MAEKWSFLNIDENKEKNIHEKLIEENFLRIKNDKISRIDEMMLAMSLGKAAPTPIEKKKGVVRAEYVNESQESKALMVANAIGSIEGMAVMNGDLSKESICKLTDECSNTGYSILENLMNSTPVHDREIYLIENYLDKLYEENVLKEKEHEL